MQHNLNTCHVTVGVAEFGKENFRELARMPEEKRAEVWKAYEQWTRWMEKDAALNNGQGVVLIIDFDGFSLANYGSSEGGGHLFFNLSANYLSSRALFITCNTCFPFESALKLGLRVFSYLIRQHKAIRYGFLINGTKLRLQATCSRAAHMCLCCLNCVSELRR